MQNKTLFNGCSISYSQFLQSKEQAIHSLRLTEAKNFLIDIEFFRRSISVPDQNLYAKKKRQNKAYRSTFFGFSLIFLILSIIIFYKTANFTCGYYFKNCLIIKNCINCISLLLAGGAFALGYKIYPKKEIVHDLIGKGEKELTFPAKQWQIEFNAIIAHLSKEWITPHKRFGLIKRLDKVI